MKFTDLAHRLAQHVIVGGDPFSGKSTMASQLAEHGFKLTWFALDSGHKVLQKLSQRAQDNIEIIVLPDTKTFPIGIDTIRKVLRGGEHIICDRHGQINCSVCKKAELQFSRVNLDELAGDMSQIVVIDTISQVADSADNYVRKAAKLGDDEKFTYDEYAHWLNIMKEICCAIQNAPYNVVCLSHLVESEMEDGKKKLVPMVGSTVFSRKVGGYFDHVVFMEINNLKHAAASSSTFRMSVLSGSRTDIDVSKLDKPSLVPFFNGSIKSKEGENVQRATQILEQSKQQTQASVAGINTGGAINISNNPSDSNIVSSNKPVVPPPAGNTGIAGGAGSSSNMHSSVSVKEALDRLKGK